MFQFAQSETNGVRRRIFFYASAVADGYTPVTSGLSTSTVVSVTKNGVIPATTVLSPTFTHISNGLWFHELSQSLLDTVGIVTVTITDALIRPVQAVGYVYAGDPLTVTTPPTVADIWTYTTRTLTASLDPTAAQIWSNATRTLTASLDPTASQIWANATRTLTASLDPTAAAIADAVWDEAYAAHTTAGSFGKLLDLLRKANYVTEGTVTSAVTATNTTFSTTLTNEDGALDHQSLLFLTGNHIGTSIPILHCYYVNGLVELEEPLHDVPSVGSEFVVLPDHVHAVQDIADGILNRLLDSSGSSIDVFNERTVRSALRAMRNKVSVVSGTMAVYKEDDDNVAWEGTVSNTADVTVNPDGGS